MTPPRQFRGKATDLRADQPRRAAYDVLHEVGAGDAYAHVALPQIIKAYQLDQRDAGFVTDLVNGALRFRGSIDAVLASCCDRSLESLDPRVLDVLRMGGYQLLIMKTDPYAAVNTSVDLVASVAGDGPKGLVNAVLRRVSLKPFETWMTLLAPAADEDPDGNLSVTYSHPRWMVSALRDSLGRERRAQLPDLLAANNAPPHATLVAWPGQSSVAELELAGAVPAAWSEYAAAAPPGRLTQLAAVREGRAGIQDEGSQLVAIAIANAVVAGQDRNWLDLCAGPGGKTALLSAIAGTRSAAVVAVELHPHRAKLVAQLAAGSPGFAGVVVGDSRRLPIAATMDRVLVDVPCTGLGVLRRRPDIRWRRQPGDIPALTKLQTQLLNAAVDATRPGGVIGYATCSPHLAETDFIVRAVAKKREDVAIEDARDLFPGVSDLGSGPFVRLWPHTHDTDGMFFALMRRREATPTIGG